MSSERVTPSLLQVEETLSDSLLKSHVTAQKLEFEFSSAELAAIRFPLPLVENLEQLGYLEQSDRLKLELAFQEAITNSLDHGNLELDSSWREQIDDKGVDHYSQVKKQRLQDPRFANRKIYLAVEFRDQRLTIQIRDEGQGFIKATGGQTKRLLSGIACHGRGMAIIADSVDQVDYHRQGREIVMVKDLKDSE